MMVAVVVAPPRAPEVMVMRAAAVVPHLSDQPLRRRYRVGTRNGGNRRSGRGPRERDADGEKRSSDD